MDYLSGQTFSRFNNALLDLWSAPSVDVLAQALLAHIPRLVAMDTCVFFSVGNDQWQYVDLVSSCLDDTLFTLYKSEYEVYDDYKRAVFAMRPLPYVDRSSDYMDYRAWAMNPHRAEFLLPNGMYHLAGMQVIDRGSLIADLSFHRDVGPDFSDADMLLLRGLQRHVTAILERLRLRPAPPPVASPIPRGLTAREFEIATLAAQGLRTREIAARLMISQNTVKTHLKHLLAKTGARNRVELASALLRGRA